ncbi:response regulator [Ectobacillus funiculus]|uniref:response regulator n=1 Tax=Ectobacillus funiculus TaxID=137993 RepID=UPI00397CC47D
MIRLLLADDEPIIIRGLKKLLPWQSLEVEIIGEVYNGLDLIAAVKEKAVDILVTDICMPGLSGVDVLKEIRELDLNTKVIFISGYEEFSYARDAMKHGAIDYLVKPVDKVELERVVLQTVSLIMKERNEISIQDKLNRLEKKDNLETSRNYLDSLIEGELIAQGEIDIKQDFFLYGPLFSVAILEIDRINNENNSWDERERKLVTYSISNIMNEVILEEKIGTFYVKENRFVMILNHSADTFQFLSSLQEKINQFLHIEVSIGVGVSVNSLEEVHVSYETSKSALNTKYFLGFNQVIPYKEHKNRNLSEQDLFEYQDKIMECFMLNDFKQLEGSLSELLKNIKAFSFGNQSLAVSTCFSFVIILTQSLQKFAVNLSGWESDIQQIKSKMNETDSYDGLSLVVENIISKLYQLLSDNNLNKETLIMIRVKKFIEEHYSEDITLETVASIAFMNPYYFSSFFKKHTKQNFKHYLTEVRMKHAVQLLLHSDMLIYEIAEKVGYKNPRQFSDMFRKTFGKLPIDYKQQFTKA